jgi:hypothetical protein
VTEPLYIDDLHVGMQRTSAGQTITEANASA